MHSMERSTALNEPIGRDRFTVLEAGASIDFDDVLPSWLMPFGTVGDAQSHLDVNVRQGLPFFGATSDDQNFKSRLEGTAQFTSVNARFERTQSIANRVDLYVAAKGQYSFDTLLSSEEFRLGGDEFGRGYNPSEIAGEHGVGGTIELRYSDRPGWTNLQSYEAYVFYDYGMVWNNDAGFPARSDLASAGIGARTEVRDDTYLDVELTRTLTRIIGSRNTPEDTYRLLVRATVQF
jgi:hemolysin activation/secretion protein